MFLQKFSTAKAKAKAKTKAKAKAKANGQGKRPRPNPRLRHGSACNMAWASACYGLIFWHDAQGA